MIWQMKNFNVHATYIIKRRLFTFSNFTRLLHSRGNACLKIFPHREGNNIINNIWNIFRRKDAFCKIDFGGRCGFSLHFPGFLHDLFRFALLIFLLDPLTRALLLFLRITRTCYPTEQKDESRGKTKDDRSRTTGRTRSIADLRQQIISCYYGREGPHLFVSHIQPT